MAPNHLLLVMDLWIKRPRQGRQRYEKRIRGTALQDEAKKIEFKVKVLERMNVNVVEV